MLFAMLVEANQVLLVHFGHVVYLEQQQKKKSCFYFCFFSAYLKFGQVYG